MGGVPIARDVTKPNKVDTERRRREDETPKEWVREGIYLSRGLGSAPVKSGGEIPAAFDFSKHFKRYDYV